MWVAVLLGRCSSLSVWPILFFWRFVSFKLFFVLIYPSAFASNVCSRLNSSYSTRVLLSRSLTIFLSWLCVHLLCISIRVDVMGFPQFLHLTLQTHLGNTSFQSLHVLLQIVDFWRRLWQTSNHLLPFFNNKSIGKITTFLMTWPHCSALPFWATISFEWSFLWLHVSRYELFSLCIFSFTLVSIFDRWSVSLRRGACFGWGSHEF